jgi:outer membrane protein OmpA-like peptidoglycan-associated protein
MAEQKLTAKQLSDGVTLATDESHRITVLAAKRLRLVGLFFDLDRHPDANLLIVGHTDTSGREEYNRTLSLERADAIAAYLTDKTAPWEAFFADSKPEEKRWGTLEVQHMLSVLPQGEPPFFGGQPNGVEDALTTQAVKDFQEANGLEVDGIVGPITQKALIEDYMALDGTSLPAGMTLTTHGCGENFPVDETGDGVRDPDNRRVEVFFFDGPIDPAPPGKTSKKGSPEYPKWLEQVEQTLDVTTGIIVADVIRLRLHADPERLLSLDDQFRLFNDTGFEQILDMPKAVDEEASSVDLIFKAVPIDQSYSLEVVRTSGDNYLLLDDVPFAAIDGNADDPADVGDVDPLELEPEDEDAA